MEKGEDMCIFYSVNALVHEPIGNNVCSVTGSCLSTSVKPYPRDNITWSFMTILIETPGTLNFWMASFAMLSISWVERLNPSNKISGFQEFR